MIATTIAIANQKGGVGNVKQVIMESWLQESREMLQNVLYNFT